MQLSPDGKTLVTAGDCTLRLWDTDTRKAGRVLRGQIGPRVDDTPGHGQVLRLAISRDSAHVVALRSWRADPARARSALSTEVQVFALASSNLVAAFNAPARWVDLCFSPDGRWLVLAGCVPRAQARLQVHAWADVLRAGFGKAPAVVSSLAFGGCTLGDTQAVAAAFVPGVPQHGAGARLVVATNPARRVGGSAGRLCWAVLSRRGQLTAQHSVRVDGPIAPGTLAVSARLAAVASAPSAGPAPSQVLCHDHAGQRVATLVTEGSASALAFSATGGALLVGLHARQPSLHTVQISVYDSSGGALLAKRAGAGSADTVPAFGVKSTYYGHDGSISAAAFCADGTVASSGGDTQALHFWTSDHRTGQALAVLRGAGRRLWHAGIDEQQQIGFGALPDRLLPAGHPQRQQRFDLNTMTLHAAGAGELEGCQAESAQWRLRADATGTTMALRCRATGSDPAASPDLTLFVGSDDEWVLFTRSGYYNASRRGDRYVGYHVNRGPAQEALFLPGDRFSPLFYRRDLVRAVVQHGSEALARAQDVDMPAVDVTAWLPPVVELAAKGCVVRGEKVTLRFKVESPSPANPALRVWLLQNKRFAWAAPKLSATGEYKLTRTLQPGPNTFKLLAEGQRSRSLPVAFTVPGPATAHAGHGADHLPGTLHLLCVGVSDFAAAGTEAAANFKPLLFAHADAIAVHSALGHGRFGGGVGEPAAPSNKAFKAVNARLLLNGQATRQGILDALNALCAQIRAREKTHPAERDVLFVFLAGHGVRVRGSSKLYFWNHDLDPRPQHLDDTGLSMVELGRIATAVPAEVVIAMDACHSGMAGANALAGLNAEELSRRIAATNERGVYIMNAARSEEMALENVGAGHGFFTSALLTALRLENSLVTEKHLRADAAGYERELSMLGLIAAVQELVPYRTKDKQTSVFRMYGDLLPLTIYKQ